MVDYSVLAANEWSTTRGDPGQVRHSAAMDAELGSGGEPRATAIGRLPPPYAFALRLKDAGVTDEVVAEALGIDPVSLPPFLKLAEAKLAAILVGQGSGEDMPN